jgi:FkbM family methyltransferase
MKFYGQFNPPLDQVLYERYFLNFKGSGVCLECGAVDGINISSTYFFEETLGWKSINIEPHPDSFEKLIKNRPKSTNINLALSNQEGESYLVTGNKFFLRAYVVDKPRSNTITIRKGIYKNIVENLPIDHIDLMVLDVEGHEIKALEGMVGARVLPSVLCIEINHVDRKQVKCIVEEMGYVFDSSITINDIYRRK